MLGKCGLAPEVNNCPHYARNNESCEIGNEVCGFFKYHGKEKDITYKRKPRWYEQYYKR